MSVPADARRRRLGLVVGPLLALGVLVAWLPYLPPVWHHLQNAGRGAVGAPAGRAFAPSFFRMPARPPRDAVLDYHQALYPAAARAVVTVAARVDPYARILRGLPYLLLAVTLVGAAAAAAALAGPGAAWAAGILILGCAGGLLAQLAGTPPWAFGAPFLVAFLGALAAGRMLAAALLALVLAALSPFLALGAGLAFAYVVLVAPAEQRGTAAGWSRRRGRVVVGVVGAGVLAGSLLVVADLAPFGRPLSPSDAAEYPEVGPRGPSGGIPDLRLDQAAAAELGELTPWGPPIFAQAARLRQVLGGALPWLLAGLLLACALALARDPAGRRLLVGAAALAVVAVLLRPLRPWLDPTRRTELFPLFVLAAVFLPAGLGRLAARRRGWKATLGAALAGALLLAGFGGRGELWSGLEPRRDPHGVLVALRALPAGAVVAGAPVALDDLMFAHYRRAFVAENVQLPYHEGIARVLRERMRLVIDAMFAPGDAGWQALRALREAGATHVLVDRDLFVQPRILAPEPFAGWWAAARARAGGAASVRAVRSGFPLLALTHGKHTVLDLGEMEAAEQLRAFAHPKVPVDRDAWALRALALRLTLRAAAELPLPGPVAAEPLGRRVVDGVVIEDLRLRGWRGLGVPAALYLPEHATGPVPAVCLFVGHDRSGQRAYYVRQLAWRLARHGIAALTTDWMGMGTRFRDDARHMQLGLRLIPAGTPPVAPMLGEPLIAFEYLTTRPEIDPARIGVAGQSGGGIVAMHLAALEPRVAAAVVVDIVVTNDFIADTGWGDPDTFVPGSMRLTDHGEILAMVAPRPLLVLSGDLDPVAPSRVAAQALAFTRAVYALHGAGDRVDHQGTAERHTWSDAKIAATLRFFGETFTGAPIVDTSNPPESTLPQAGLAEGEPAWIDHARADLARTPAPPPDAKAWRAQAVRVLADRVGPVPPLTLPAPDAGPVTLLWVTDRGGDLSSPIVLEAAADRVLTVTPTGMGVTMRWTEHQRLHLVQDAIALGGTLLGPGVGRLAAEARAARRAGARRVLAVCDGRQAALVCIVAAALHQPFDGLVLEDLPADFAETFYGPEVPALYYVTPGLFRSFSPEMLVAMAAPTPVILVEKPALARPFASAVAAALGGRVEAADSALAGALRLRRIVDSGAVAP